MNNLISILVPVYNAEKFLVECIESILAQSYDNWELILVDDGSKDASGAICDGYANRDKRIKVIHQPNAGANRARQRGVMQARGEYITFVDADDTLTPDALEKLMALTDNDRQVDIVAANYDHAKSIKVAESIDCETYRYRMVRGDYPGPVAKLYRRELFDDNVFDMSRNFIVGEDWLMGVRLAFKNTKRVRLIPDVIYNYRQHDGSTMHTFKVSPEYEHTTYCNIKSSIPADLYEKYVPALIENKISFLQRFICYRGMNPDDGWLGSDFFADLQKDIVAYNFPLDTLENIIFFKASRPAIRKIMITLWKIRNRLKRC